MTKRDAINRRKSSYKNTSDDDLLATTHLWDVNKPNHIAAKQEIESRKRDISIAQYKIDKSTNLLTKLILALTVVLLILTSVQLSHSFGVFGFSNIVSVNFPQTAQNTKNTKQVNNQI